MNAPIPPDATLAGFIDNLEARARAANNLAELGFSMVNDSYGLLPFRQALVFEDDGRQGDLLAVSGLARPTEDSPYLVWLRRAWRWLREQLPAEPGWFTPGEPLPEDLIDGWREWWPTGLFALPLRRRDGTLLGWACFLLDEPPHAVPVAMLVKVGATWSYCWEMLAGAPAWHRRWPQRLMQRRRWIAVAVVALMFVPIRLSALAPAEVIALDAEAIAAPIDGVIKTLHVRPSQAVKAGERLFSLDDTTLRNRLEVTRKTMAVADAELTAATQKAFDSLQSKGDLGSLAGRAQERRAELASIESQLTRVDVLAPRDGVAVYGDPNDWLGRPVTTGERILLLADPHKPGVLIHLPVADAIALEIGAPVRLFLAATPLTPLDAVVIETSYQALSSPEGVASYRLRAAFTADVAASPNAARIGLRGTAKVYGERVPLAYYLMRRPLSALRQWTGL